MMGNSSRRFMLKAADGRMATYDTRFGPALTTNIALGYVWTEAAAAETQRPLYETALGTELTITPEADQEMTIAPVLAAETAVPTPSTPPRFYRGDLPPRPADLERIRRALQRGPLTRQALIERAGLSQTQTLCAVDALIASGEISYLADKRQFSARQTA